jgi:hypothetical protein
VGYGYVPGSAAAFQNQGFGRFDLRGDVDINLRVPLRMQRDFTFGGNQWVQPWPTPGQLPFQLPATLPAYSPYDTGSYAFFTGPGGQTAGWTTGPGGTQIYGPQGGQAGLSPYGQGYVQGPYGGGVQWQRPQTFQAFPGAPLVGEQLGRCP